MRTPQIGMRRSSRLCVAISTEMASPIERGTEMATGRVMVILATISLAMCSVPRSLGSIFTGTGADIFNNPDFSFPSRPANLNGTVLEFDPGAVVDLDNGEEKEKKRGLH